MKEELSQAIARALSSGTGMIHSAFRRKPLELPAAGSAVEEVVPQYQRGALLIDSDTMSRYTRIAREAAISGVHRYSYMPTTPEEAKNWHPHSWVIDAMHLVQRDALSALSAQQSAPPEICCEHSYKVAKQSAWDARDLTHCKCDHNEYCEHCWPDDFREGGKWHGGFEKKQSAPERGDGWIPVSERLPAVAQEVIVDSEFDGVTAGFLDSYGEWYSPNSDYKLTRVVAWQPLPAAPSLKVRKG